MDSDIQLLDRYVVDRDPDAFRGLVLRHGAAVFRECLRLVPDPSTADDAFQATFLVLVRKAHTLEDSSRIRGWLIGVARRVALRARRDELRRRQRECERIAVEPGVEDSRPMDADVRAILADEVDLLPIRYREPIQLCYIEGMTHEDAARALGLPLGTVKVRLVRARRKLRDRLDRRGLVLSLALLLLLRSELRASDMPSPGLVDETVDAMRLVEAGELGTVARRYPRAANLVRLRRWSYPFFGGVLLLMSLLFLGGVAAAACSRNPADAEQPEAQLPANLKDILAVDCR